MNPTMIGMIATLMWSCAAVFVAMADRIPAFQLMAVTWLIGALAVAAYNAATGNLRLAHWKRPLRDYLFVLAGIAGNTVLYYFAFKMAPPFEANTLNYLWPIMLIAFIDITERKKPDPRQLAGMALGFAGCVLLLSGGKEGAFEHLTAGHLYAICGATVWALYCCFAKNRDYPSGFMVPIYLVSTLIFAAGHFAAETWVAPDAIEWLAIIVIGLIDTAYVFWDHGIRKGNRTLLTSVSYFIPLFSTILLVAGGFGAQSPAIMLAAAMVIAGCITVNWPQVKKAFLRKN